MWLIDVFNEAISKKIPQTTGTFRRPEEGSYCALGLVRRFNDYPGEIYKFGLSNPLSEEDVKKLEKKKFTCGLSGTRACVVLALNDYQKMSFEEIRDFIIEMGWNDYEDIREAKRGF